MFEASISELAEGLRTGRWTSRSLTEEALRRIAEIDQSGPGLNAIAEVNPDALWIADALDRELQETGPRGPLHGLPVVVKDNISTAGKMHTTAGSVALADFYAPQDAEVVRRLKRAGAVILGKACLSEFAYWVARKRKMPSGFSSRSGQVVNPYDPQLDPAGSSSGSAVAVAAQLVPFSIGTETNGSLVSPARNNAVATIKPTVGLISRSGIIPISSMQDTAGPMGKTIADCAVVLDALWGKDELDPATLACPDHFDFAGALNRGVAGFRIGVLTFDDAPQDELENTILEQARQILIQQGAALVPVSLPQGRLNNLPVLEHEFKNGINAWLGSVRGCTAMRTLDDILAYNRRHAQTCLRYGQDLLESSNRTSGTLREADYLRQRLALTRQTRTEGIDRLLKEYQLDCLMTVKITGYAPIAGYPCAAVCAQSPDQGTPCSVLFLSTAWSEETLITAAHALETKLCARHAPIFQ